LDKKTIANLYGTEFKNKNYLSSEYIKKAKQDLLEVLSRFSWNTKNTLFFDNLNLYDRTILDCCAQYLSCFINPKTIEAVFGLKKCYFWYYILLQLAPVLLISELKKRTTVILTEADQVGFFYILRDICNRVNIKKPIVIVVKGIKGLDLKEKMSSVKPQNCVLLLKENVLSKLRKGISGQDPQSDFCHHLLQNGLKLVENSSSKIQSELEDLLKNNNTFKAKVSLSQYFEKFFENKKRKLNFGLKKDLRLKNLEELEKQFETCFEYKT
jgi:tryptophanyl-tRNA synthetase